MIQAATYTSEAENRANAKAIRQRLMFGGKKTAADNQNAPAVKREAEPRDREFFPQPKFVTKKLPLWEAEEIRFDHHETAWAFWKAETMAANGSPLKAYIRRRANEMGLSYSKVVGPSRAKHVVKVRHQIIWEVKRMVKTDASYPEIGRLFGGLDHTSCLYAVRKMDLQNGYQEGV